MELRTEQLAFENLCKQLIGLTIVGVEYLEINYTPEQPTPSYTTHVDNIHSVNYSILFYTGDKLTIEIC